MSLRFRTRGFTLIELMISVAVVAILAAIAFPTYREHVRKSRRAEAQAFLMALAARQQQFLVDTRGYAATLATIALAAPSNVGSAYTLTLATAAGPPPTFVVSAVPKITSDQTLERCGTLAIDQNGTKTASLSSCW